MICHNNNIPFLNLRDFEKLFEIFYGLIKFHPSKISKKRNKIKRNKMNIFEIFDGLRCLTDRSLSCKNKRPNYTMIIPEDPAFSTGGRPFFYCELK